MPWALDEPDEQSSLPYLERAEAQWEAGEAFFYAMVDAPNSSTVLGSCGLMRRVDEGGLEIGYWVHAEHTRQGLATAAVTALTSAGFGLPGVDHVEIHTDQANAPSRALAARLGYEHVATRPRERQAPSDSGQDEVWRMTSAQWSAPKATTVCTEATR